MQKSVESERSFCSLPAAQCWMSMWTRSLETSTELGTDHSRHPTSTIGEAFADTNLPKSRGPGAIPGEWTDVCGFVTPPGLVENGRSVCVELSQCPTRPSASVQKIEVAIMKFGYTCTSLASVCSRVTRKTRAAGPPQRKVLSIPS